jgi:hypothetical protein
VARSGLDALARAQRVSSGGDGLLSQTLAGHLDEVAEQLRVDVSWLAALDVESTEQRKAFGRVLAEARARRVQERAAASLERRVGLANQLVAAAVWRADVIELSPSRLFTLASSARASVLSLETPTFAVHVSRPLLVRARPVLTKFNDLTASLDAEALHLRWRDGRGAFHHRCPPPAPRDEPAFAVRFDAPRVARPPVLLADVLRDLGLLTA